MTTKSHNPLGAVCGGELEATTITHEVKRGTHMSLFQQVPAQVCTACREIWIDEEVLQVIDRFIESGVPVQTVETPVYDFPRAGSPAHGHPAHTGCPLSNTSSSQRTVIFL